MLAHFIACSFILIHSAVTIMAQPYIKEVKVPDDAFQWTVGDPLIPTVLTTATAINAIESDYLSLFRSVSVISDSTTNSGTIHGIFAKVDIPKDSIICEFRGPIVSDENAFRFLDAHVYSSIGSPRSLSSNKVFGAIGPGIHLCAGK